MIPIETMFVGLVIFFGLIGALRGWAKELLVVFSVILARFVETVLLAPDMPFVGPPIAALEMTAWFYIRLVLFIFLVYFGYASPVVASFLRSRGRKDKFQDTLLGFFIGCINGILVVGTVWGFLHEHNYGLAGITPPTSEAAVTLIKYLPFTWMRGMAISIGVAVSLAFVLIVFV
jgi:uncharacterized membrane protein required for colicin V production